jgi:hypothetical protein
MRPRDRAVLTIGAVLLTAILTTGPVLAADGWLDPTFGNAGIVVLRKPSIARGPMQQLLVRAGPGGRTYVFEALRSEGGEGGVGFLRVRSPSGGVLSSYVGTGTVLLGSSGDGLVSGLGLFPLPKGAVIYAVAELEGGTGPAEKVVRRNADGRVVKARGIPGVVGDLDESLSPLTRLPGGAIRGCRTTPTAGGDDVRLVGLTPSLDPDSRLGPSFYATLAVASCRNVTSDPAGRTYVLGARTVAGAEAIDISAYGVNGDLIMSWGVGGHQTIAAAATDIRLRPGQVVAFADGSMRIPAEAQGTSLGSMKSAAILSLGPNGIIDSGFSGDGIATFQPAGGSSDVFAMDVDSSGRTVVSLVYYLADGSIRPMIARVTTGGVLDGAFGNGGVVMLQRACRDLDVDSADRIVCVAADGGEVRLSRRT